MSELEEHNESRVNKLFNKKADEKANKRREPVERNLRSKKKRRKECSEVVPAFSNENVQVGGFKILTQQKITRHNSGLGGKSRRPRVNTKKVTRQQFVGNSGQEEPASKEPDYQNKANNMSNEQNESKVPEASNQRIIKKQFGQKSKLTIMELRQKNKKGTLTLEVQQKKKGRQRKNDDGECDQRENDISGSQVDKTSKKSKDSSEEQPATEVRPAKMPRRKSVKINLSPKKNKSDQNKDFRVLPALSNEKVANREIVGFKDNKLPREETSTDVTKHSTSENVHERQKMAEKKVQTEKGYEKFWF